MLFLHLWTGTYAQKPNILWITIEDTSPQFIGCYGNEDASIPVIDQLPKEGVRCTNAFSTGSVTGRVGLQYFSGKQRLLGKFGANSL